MAYTVEASSPAFRVRASAVRRYSGRKELLPDTTWTGLDTTLATCVLQDDGTVLITPRDAPGTFTITASSASLPDLAPGSLDITLTEEGFDRIEIEVVPV